MPEEQIVNAKPSERDERINIASDPFSDGVPAPALKEEIKQPENIDTQVVEKKEPEETETVDADEFLAKETGWKTWDEAKAAKAELDEFRKLPKGEQNKFSTEEREKLFEDAYPILQSKKQLERVEKLDASKPKDAAEIIKLDLQLKNKDLSQDDVDFIFSEKYEVPDKPKKTDDIDDDEYATKVAKWESQVERINRRLSVDAKLAKPELSKFKSELVLPDIPKAEPVAQAPSQEVLAAQKAMRDNYLQAVESSYSKFDGFNTKVQDEAAEIPVAYQIHNDEKAAIKKLMQEMNVDEYFGTRWFDDKGNAKVERMMSDLYLLENTQKVLDGISEKAASAKFKGVIKTNSNIKLNGNGSSTQTNMQQPASRREKEETAIWSA